MCVSKQLKKNLKYKFLKVLFILILANGEEPQMFCDFESPGLCGWSNDLSHNFDWTRHNNMTPSGYIQTGPKYDHTKGLGKNGMQNSIL